MLRSRTMLRGSHPVSLRQRRFVQRRRERWLVIGPGLEGRQVDLRRETIVFVERRPLGSGPLRPFG